MEKANAAQREGQIREASALPIVSKEDYTGEVQQGEKPTSSWESANTACQDNPLREAPASPMQPREDTPVEGEETTEEADTEAESSTPKREVAQEGPAWQRNTRPAEPEAAPRPTNEVKLETEQLAYLVYWLSKEKSHRMEWERERAGDQEQEEMEVARKLAKMGKKAGKEMAYLETRDKLRKLMAIGQDHGEEKGQGRLQGQAD